MVSYCSLVEWSQQPSVADHCDPILSLNRSSIDAYTASMSDAELTKYRWGESMFSMDVVVSDKIGARRQLATIRHALYVD